MSERNLEHESSVGPPPVSERPAPPPIPRVPERDEPAPHDDAREREDELYRLREKLGSQEKEPGLERVDERESSRLHERSVRERTRSEEGERPLEHKAPEAVEEKTPAWKKMVRATGALGGALAIPFAALFIENVSVGLSYGFSVGKILLDMIPLLPGFISVNLTLFGISSIGFGAVVGYQLVKFLTRSRRSAR